MTTVEFKNHPRHSLKFDKESEAHVFLRRNGYVLNHDRDGCLCEYIGICGKATFISQTLYENER